MEIVYLSLGANLGLKFDNITKAIDIIKRDPQIVFVKQSRFYETEPVGVVDQPSFINVAICIKVSYSPCQLLDVVKEIERRVGRTPTYRWGPRVIDIDILYYGNDKICNENLIIPHPRIEDRAFVMIPLMELNGDFKNKFKPILKHNNQVVKLCKRGINEQ